MSDDGSFDSLFAHARAERPPRMDVLERAMRSIRAQEERNSGSGFERPFAFCAAIAAALALFVAMPALHAYVSLIDPFSGLMQMADGVLR